jgi:hypothetical protein
VVKLFLLFLAELLESGIAAQRIPDQIERTADYTDITDMRQGTEVDAYRIETIRFLDER